MLENVKRSIEVSTSFVGLHCYPQADDSEEYLRVLHRHVFHVYVTISVAHDDREIEFFALKRVLERWIHVLHCDDYGVWHMDTLSCEQVAEQIAEMLDRKYCKKQKRQICVKVFEDNENGAIIEGECNGL